MSLVSRIKSFVTRNNPLENPAVSLSSPAAWSWLSNGDPTAAGEIINDLTALQIVTVFSCVRCISESVASLPLQLWKRDGKSKIEAIDSPLYSLLAISPNVEMTAFSFWETFTGCLALTGNSYAQIERDQNGQPIALWPLNPRQTHPIRLPNGELAYKTTDGEPTGRWRIVTSADMLHCPLFSLDGIQGLSPIEQARQSLGLARAAEKYGARFFGNGARPGGILATQAKLDENQRAEVKESWQSAQGGTNQGKTAVLHGDWTYTAIGLSPEEGQFLETQEFSRQQIAALFRVPVHMLGDTSRLSNNNATQQNLTFVTDCLRSYLSRIEGEIARKLLNTSGKPGELFATFDVRERLRGDFQQTMTGLALARQWGFASINDCLAELGQNPIGPEGDVYLYPLNMGNATQLLKSPDAEQTDETEPTLGSFRSAYFRLFRDAVGKVCHREKRDLSAVTSAFEAVLSSIAALSEDNARTRLGQPDFTHDASKLIRDHLAKLTQRATDWTADKADEITATELTKAVKAIAFDANRAAATFSVSKELQTV